MVEKMEKPCDLVTKTRKWFRGNFNLLSLALTHYAPQCNRSPFHATRKQAVSEVSCHLVPLTENIASKSLDGMMTSPLQV